MRTVLLAVLALSLAACGDDAPARDPAPETPPVVTAPSARPTVGSVVETNPRLRTLARLVEAAGLTETLRDTSTAYTLFAPSDEAFAAADLAALEADSAAARAALSRHVVATRMLTPDVFADLSIETLGGSEVTFAEVGEGLAVVAGGVTARITDADLDAENGVVHIIDSVLP